MPGEVTELVFRIVGENVEILDKTGTKLGEIATKAKEAEDATGGLGTGGTASLGRYAAGASAATVATVGLGAAVATTAAAYALSARENIRRVDELNSMSTATGLTVRELSQLEYVARRNQVEVGALGGGFQALNRSIAEAANGAGRDARVFKALDIDVRDANGSLRSGIDIYRDVADALKDLPPGVEKSAAASVLFAGNYDAMLKVMKGGSAEFDRLIERAGVLNFTLDDAAVDVATRTTDALSRASAAAYGLGLSLAEPLLGNLASTSEWLAETAENANELAQKDPTPFFTRLEESARAASPALGVVVDLYRQLRDFDPSLLIGPDPNRFQDYLVTAQGGPTIPEDVLADRRGQVGPPSPSRDELARRRVGDRAEEIKRALAAALGRPDRGGQGEQNRLEQLTDQSVLGAAQARATAAQTAVTLAEQDLTIFRERLELEGVFANTQSARVTLLEGAYQQELELARRIDEAKARELDAQIAIIEARKKDHDVVEAASKGLTGQLDLLNAQGDSLRIQRDLLQGAGGQAARVADEYARARAELQAANRVVLNLGDTANTSLQRAVDGLFNRGTGGFREVLADSGKALGSSLIGGFIEAELKKREFDAMVNENFTVTLPGFMESGANQIKSIWSDAMDFLGFSAQEAGDHVSRALGGGFQQAGASAVSLGNTVNGVARNTYGAGTLGRDGAGRFVVENEFGQRFSSASQGAALDAAGGSPTPDAGGASFGSVAATAIPLIGLAVTAITEGIAGYNRAFSSIGLRKTISENDLRKAVDFTGGLFSPVTGGKGRTPDAGSNILDVVFTGGIGTVLRLAGAFVPPTEGSQRTLALQKAIDKANLPEQAVFAQDEGGVRSQFLNVIPDSLAAGRFAAAGFGSNIPGLKQPTLEILGTAIDLPGSTANGSYLDRTSFRYVNRLRARLGEAAAERPEVEALRTSESLAYGVLSTGRLRGGTLIANALTSNLLLQGVSEKEARRQVRTLAEQSGINLETGVEEAQRLYLENVFKDDPLTEENEKLLQLTTTIEGVVGIFQDDIPAGVDVSAIAFANFTEAVGVDVAEFTEDLERALDIFGRLEGTLEGGLRTGLDAGVDSLARRNQLIAGGGPVNEIIRANLDARRGLVSSLYDAVSTGFSTALTDGLQDAIQDSPAWKALTEQIANAVNGAPLGDIPALVNDLIGQSLPQIEATAAALAIVRGQLGVTPTALFGSADAIREGVKDARFDLLNPRQQEASLKSELAVIDEQIAAIRAGGIDPEEQLALRPLLDRRAEIGFELAGNASQRYAPGSQVGRNAIEYGLSVAEETAKLFVLAGNAQQPLIDASTANTSAIDRNTEAVNNNTAAQGGGGGVSAPAGAGATIIVVDASGAPITGDGERRLRAFVNEMIASGKLTAPARGKLREIGGTR